MITSARLKHNNIITEVKVSFGIDTIFLFKNSLPTGLEPKIGDEIILDFENTHFIIKSIFPLITGKQDLDNYSINIEVL